MNPSSQLAMFLRRTARTFGINGLIANLWSRGGYEDRFGPALEAEIRHGDIVWDIGANVGLYTTIFLERAGATGKVVAFEPTSACFSQLSAQCGKSSNAILINAAMGEADGLISMVINSDPMAATHQVVTSADTTQRSVNVQVRSADSFCGERPELIPTVIKIDVEGHEGSVLDGMHNVLSNPKLRCVGIEIHFGLLDERNESHRPRQIEATLKKHLFQPRWTDPSHILATR